MAGLATTRLGDDPGAALPVILDALGRDGGVIVEDLLGVGPAERIREAVSYTHLTLPTIYSV